MKATTLVTATGAAALLLATALVAEGIDQPSTTTKVDQDISDPNIPQVVIIGKRVSFYEKMQYRVSMWIDDFSNSSQQ